MKLIEKCAECNATASEKIEALAAERVARGDARHCAVYARPGCDKCKPIISALFRYMKKNKTGFPVRTYNMSDVEDIPMALEMRINASPTVLLMDGEEIVLRVENKAVMSRDLDIFLED